MGHALVQDSCAFRVVRDTVDSGTDKYESETGLSRQSVGKALQDALRVLQVIPA